MNRENQRAYERALEALRDAAEYPLYGSIGPGRARQMLQRAAMMLGTGRERETPVPLPSLKLRGAHDAS